MNMKQIRERIINLNANTIKNGEATFVLQDLYALKSALEKSSDEMAAPILEIVTAKIEQIERKMELL